MLSQEDVNAISEKITTTVALAKAKFPLDHHTQNIWKRPTFSLDLKGCSAGQANMQTNHIRINPVLFKGNRDVMLTVTIPHEIAHLVAYNVYRDHGHGKGWKNVMRRFGLVPDRCHSLDTSSVKRAKASTLPFKCKCRTHELSPLMARRSHEYNATRGRHKYICTHCKTHCIPVESVFSPGEMQMVGTVSLTNSNFNP